jgi:hypothetical protein
MSKSMYKVVEGKHQMADGSFKRASDEPFELDDAEAVKFPNKFTQFLVPVSVAPEASEDTAPPKKEEVKKIPPIPGS